VEDQQQIETFWARNSTKNCTAASGSLGSQDWATLTRFQRSNF